MKLVLLDHEVIPPPSAVGAENIFNRWTQKVQVNDVEKTEPPSNVSKKLLSPNSESVQRELRPFRERALMSATILGFGTGLGILFLTGRTRIVRRLHGVYSPAPAPRTTRDNVTARGDLHYIVVETLGNIISGKGKAFPKASCELIPGRNDTEMYLKVQGAGKFWLGLEGAMIEGSPTPGGNLAVRKELTRSMGYAKESGRWRSGPIVEGRNA